MMTITCQTSSNYIGIKHFTSIEVSWRFQPFDKFLHCTVALLTKIPIVCSRFDKASYIPPGLELNLNMRNLNVHIFSEFLL